MLNVLGGAFMATLVIRFLANWGEGTSNADANEGGGANSTTNDATWIHTFYPASLWTTAGGNFISTASATTLVRPGPLPGGGCGPQKTVRKVVSVVSSA